MSFLSNPPAAKGSKVDEIELPRLVHNDSNDSTPGSSGQLGQPNEDKARDWNVSVEQLRHEGVAESHEIHLKWNKQLILCIGLHVFLVLIHVLLLIVWATKAERDLLVSVKSTTLLSTVINAALQVFNLLLVAAITAVTQPLALRRQLSKQQNLAALADKTTAWSGLGPAALVLWENFRLPAAFLSILSITCYFGTLAVLQTTTPILFSLELTNVSHERPWETTIGTPVLYNATQLYERTYVNWTVAGPEDVYIDWFSTSAAVSLLGADTSTSHPGLVDNRIYDTLLTSSSTNGTARVNYADFHVNCGMVPNANISAFGNQPPVTKIRSNPFFYVPASYQISAGNETIHDFAMFVLNQEETAPSYWSPAEVLIRIPTGLNQQGRNLLLYSVFDEGGNHSSPIHDSTGNIGNPFTILVHDYGLDGETFPLKIQVIGCSVSSSNGTATINTVTNTLIAEDHPAEINPDRRWENWQAVENSGNLLEDYWSPMFMSRSSITLLPSNTYRWSSFCPPESQTNNTCHYPTAIEKYFTGALFGPITDDSEVPGLSSTRSDFQNATLANLEASMSRATAMMMWAAARARTFRYTASASGPAYLNQENLLSSTVTPQYGTTIVTEQNLVGQLRLQIIPLSIGTAASIILIVFATFILLPPVGQRKDFSLWHASKSKTPESLGLLEMVRLMKGAPLQRELAGFHPADHKGLRSAAMFEVAVVGDSLVDKRLDSEERLDQEWLLRA